MANTDANDATSDGAESPDFLESLRQRVEAQIAEYLARDPLEIDLAGRVDSLPKRVVDALMTIRDQLNESSRVALDNRVERSRRRSTETWNWQDLSHPSTRAILDFLGEREGQTTSLGWEDWLRRQSYHSEMAEWHEQQIKRDHELWERYEQSEHSSFRKALPPNWNSPEIDFPELDELEDLQLREGLPLAWVPPNQVLAELLSLNSSAARRRVISRESSVILRACLRELRRLRSEQTLEWRVSAREAGRAMQSGHWRAGQALAAIALDTATAQFVRSSYSDATRQFNRKKEPTPPGSSEKSLPTWYDIDYPRALLVLHSLYGAFGSYDGNGGEPVPVQFTRHGTVHSVSRRQYSKPNALIALMHLVGLLCLIEDD